MFGGGKVSGIFGEGEFTGPRTVRWRQADEFNVAVANEFRLEVFGDLSSGE